MFSKLKDLFRKLEQEREVLNQLNVLTSMREEIDHLIKETAKKVR
tara:strand:- start:99 stop:233 length:135 start_codon:yes stop_codon:yes gene_type:complete